MTVAVACLAAWALSMLLAAWWCVVPEDVDRLERWVRHHLAHHTAQAQIRRGRRHLTSSKETR